MSQPPRVRRPARAVVKRVAKLAGLAGLVAVAVAAMALAAAPLIIRGPRFGRVVGWLLPDTRGRITIGSGEWSWSMVLALARGRPARIALQDVRIVDPEGVDVLRAARLAATIELQRSPTHLSVRNLHVEQGFWRFATLAHENTVGFVAALQPAKPSPRRRTAAPGARLDIDDTSLDDVEAVVDLPTWGLVLHNLHARAELHLAPGTDRPEFTFQVADGDVRTGGEIRILSGRSAVTLPFSHGRLDRVGITDAAPEAIVLAASAVESGRSRLDLHATFGLVTGHHHDPHAAPGIDLDAQFTDAADALVAMAASRDVTLDKRVVPDHESLRLGVHGAAGKLTVDTDVASPRGGRMAVTVSFDPKTIRGSARFGAFQTASLLPESLLPMAGGRLDGEATADVDLTGGTAAFKGSTLRLTRTASRTSIAPRVITLPDARLENGVVHIPRLSLPFWGGRLSGDGTIAVWDPTQKHWLPAPRMDLDIRGEKLSSEELLGVSFVRGTVSFQARVTGTPNELTIAAEFPKPPPLDVLGQPFMLPRALTVRIVDGVVSTERFGLVGPEKSRFVISGRVATGGRLAIAIDVDDFPFRDLPGLMQSELPFSGMLSGQMRLGGAVRSPSIAGELSVDDVEFQGRPIGGGALVVRPGPHGAIHAQGRLAEGIAADGSLIPEHAGLRGDARLALDHVRLDPFLSNLPGGFSAVGTVSGTIAARIAPGRPAAASGALDALDLEVMPPRNVGAPPRPIRLAAQGQIPLAASTGGGAIDIGPARFAGDMGTFALSAHAHAGDARATLRGRIQLAPFAPLARAWITDVSGALDVDLAATGAPDAGRLDMTGTIDVAAPLGFRLTALPIQVRADAGHVRIGANRVEIASMPLSLHADGPVLGLLRGVNGAATVDAQLDGIKGDPTLRARLSAARAEATVPSLSGQAIQVDAGPVALEMQSLRRRPELTGVDLPVRGRVRGVDTTPVRIDDMGFDLHLRGDPRQRLMLSGDVALAKATVRVKALGGASKTSSAKPASPALERVQLDVKVRAPRGAVVVRVGKLPGVVLGVDAHVGGTAAKPAFTYEAHGADLYSKILLGLRNLFD